MEKIFNSVNVRLSFNKRHKLGERTMLDKLKTGGYREHTAADKKLHEARDHVGFASFHMPRTLNRA